MLAPIHGNPRKTRRQRGITLLEVMIAIGVSFMGLLGVVALLPLAVHLMNRGTTADYVAAIGRNSVSDMDIQGMLRGDHFAIWNNRVAPNQFVQFAPDPRVTTDLLGFPIDTSTPAQWRAASFCIDPLMISRTYEESLAITPAAPNLFPFVGIDPNKPFEEARMARVTLREIPGGALTANLLNPGVMRAIAADDVFRIRDDLVFNLPGRAPNLERDSTLPAVQEYSVDQNGNQKRQYNGRLSWMATFSPMVGQSGGDLQQDTYVMSVVVFAGRILDLNASPERVVEVATWWGGGVGGGDLQITPRTFNGNLRPEADLEMNGVSWVMLSGRLPPANANSPGASVFRWYRVVAADNESQFGQPGDPNYSGPNIWLRDISLQGADWNKDLFVRTQVTIVSGVVAVFEKTVRLEGPNLWAASY